MRSFFLLFFLSFSIMVKSLSAQQPSTFPAQYTQKVKYTASIQLKDKSIFKGSMYRTGDSSLILAKTNKWFVQNTTITEAVPVTDIVQITTMRRKGGGRGALIGLGLGAVLGGLIGYASYSPSDAWLDFGPGLPAIGGALIGLPSGAILGGIIGSIKQTFQINGNQRSYAAQRKKLKSLSITGQ